MGIAASHGIRNLSSIERIDAPRSFEGQESMGDVLIEAFDRSIYTLGITAHGGEFGAFDWDDEAPKPIQKPSPGSIEALLGVCHPTIRFWITDVPNDNWISKKQGPRLLGYAGRRVDGRR